MDSLVGSALNRVQHNAAVHERWLGELSAACSDDPEQFAGIVESLISRVLCMFKREPTAMRVLDFVSKMITSERFPQFGQHMLSCVQEWMGARDKAVRFRATQLLTLSLEKNAEVLSTMRNGLELVEGVQLRLNDRVVAIRAQAVRAVAHLLATRGAPSSEFVQPKRRSTRSKRSRGSTEEKQAPALVDIKALLDRLLNLLPSEASASVRKAVFVSLRSCAVGLTILDNSEVMAQLVRLGLSDANSGVRVAVVKYIADQWLPAEGIDHCVHKLLERMDCVAHPTEAEIMVRALMESSATVRAAMSEATPTPPYYVSEELKSVPSAAALLFWRVFCAFLCDTEQASQLEVFAPSGVSLVDTITLVLSNANQDTHLFLLREAALLSMQCDSCDEIGRAALQKFWAAWIAEFAAGVQDVGTVGLQYACKALHHAFTGVDGLREPDIQAVAEFCEALFNQLTPFLHKLASFQEDQAPLFDKETAPVWRLTLSMAATFLQLLQLPAGSESTESEEKGPESYVRSCLSQLKPFLVHGLMAPKEHDALAVLSLQALGHFAVVTGSAEEAGELLGLMVHALEKGSADVRGTALRGIFNLLCVYGGTIFADSEATMRSTITTLITQCLRDSEMCTGMAKCDVPAVDASPPKRSAGLQEQGYVRFMGAQMFSSATPRTVRSVLVDGLCKLLMLNRLTTLLPDGSQALDFQLCVQAVTILLAALQAFDDTHSRQLLSTFLPTFASIGYTYALPAVQGNTVRINSRILLASGLVRVMECFSFQRKLSKQISPDAATFADIVASAAEQQEDPFSDSVPRTHVHTPFSYVSSATLLPGDLSEWDESALNAILSVTSKIKGGVTAAKKVIAMLLTLIRLRNDQSNFASVHADLWTLWYVRARQESKDDGSHLPAHKTMDKILAFIHDSLSKAELSSSDQRSYTAGCTPLGSSSPARITTDDVDSDPVDGNDENSNTVLSSANTVKLATQVLVAKMDSLALKSPAPSKPVNTRGNADAVTGAATTLAAIDDLLADSDDDM